MKVIFRSLSCLMLAVSIGSFALVWWHDIGGGFQYDAGHIRLASPPFIFIGVAFIFFQLSLGRPWRERVKGLLLGLAFTLWGSEQFLPPGVGLTLLDNLVIAIFVVDLGLIICDQFLAGK